MSVRQSKESDAIFDLAILQGLSEAEHRSVRRTLEKRRLKPNETFVEEGTEADRVYFLIAGEIAVTLRGSLITFIEAPTVVGLLAVIGNPEPGRSPRSVPRPFCRFRKRICGRLFARAKPSPTMC